MDLVDKLLGWVVLPFLNGAAMGTLGILYRFGFGARRQVAAASASAAPLAAAGPAAAGPATARRQ
ncbi:hypothetical protein HK105_208870 [Polyrhizophydium stewartii]|uniref:Uncharacterized protein n=1 Tax=Polyrhizophydium stewartii TaxID=2732419 RepID=A0ABR4MWL6_9FUNG